MRPRLETYLSVYLNLNSAVCVVPSFNSMVNSWQVPAQAASVCQVNLYLSLAAL